MPNQRFLHVVDNYTCQTEFFLVSFRRFFIQAFCVIIQCLVHFFLQNVWLSLSACYYGQTSLLTLRVCFPSLHNGRKKLRNSHMTLRTEENSSCHFLIFFNFLHMHICFTRRGDVSFSCSAI